MARDGATMSREGNVGPPVDVAQTTRASSSTTLTALERALAAGDIACVLAEPAMTNMGIVLPEAPYHEALRALTREHGTLLIIDETHTFSAGPGGCTRAWGLEPDLLTIGKAIGGGSRAGRSACPPRWPSAPPAPAEVDFEDTGGIGGTLAGNALSLAAIRACLGRGADRRCLGPHDPAGHAVHGRRSGRDRAVGARVERHPARLPGRVPLRAGAGPQRHPGPRRRPTPRSSASCTSYALNRGVLITPFHNMALMAPDDHRGRRGPPHRRLRRRRRLPSLKGSGTFNFRGG